MVETPSTQAERRCASCGAVLYEGAAWCGMCFEPVASHKATVAEPKPEPKPEAQAASELPEPAPQAGSAPAVPATEAEAQPMWPCPICDSRNPIELDNCATCGASFASLMRQETTLVKVDPRAAFRRSLLFPGLGHRMVPGREVDGFARGVLFAMLLLATLMLGFSGVRAGAVLLLFLIYLGASVLVYLLTASEAARLAEGGEPLVSSRTLLWATVAILLLSIVVVAFVIGTASRR
ncbi:MAG: hypothetical protein ABI595_05215 [Actinomycetota bacterium]